MPIASKGARLWLRRERRDKQGRITHPAVYVIRDGEYQESTGCGQDDRSAAERKLESYLNRKHTAQAKQSVRDPDQIPVADVLGLYAADVAPNHARPKETLQRVERLLAFFGNDKLSAISGDRCRAFARSRSTSTAAREDLSVLRAAINHHRREGLCEKIVSVVLPGKPAGRDRWCTRGEAARLLRASWRFREIQKGKPTDRRTRRHVAKFILVALYTGTRASAVCAAALEPTEGKGWIDLEKGIFYRRPAGVRETKKRRPPVPLPGRLLAHLRRWKRLGQRYAVEWNGEPVKDVDKAFRNVARAAKLPDVTPHALRHTAANVADAARHGSVAGGRISRDVAADWAAGATGGISKFPVLPGVDELRLLLDHDCAGEACAGPCRKRWQAAGRKVVRLRPPQAGHDFNDVVLEKLRAAP